MIRIDTVLCEGDRSSYVLAAITTETPARVIPLCQHQHKDRKEARECQTALPIARTIRTAQSLEALEPCR